jgi:hypothetical protein
MTPALACMMQQQQQQRALMMALQAAVPQRSDR